MIPGIYEKSPYIHYILRTDFGTRWEPPSKSSQSSTNRCSPLCQSSQRTSQPHMAPNRTHIWASKPKPSRRHQHSTQSSPAPGIAAIWKQPGLLESPCKSFSTNLWWLEWSFKTGKPRIAPMPVRSPTDLYRANPERLSPFSQSLSIVL